MVTGLSLTNTVLHTLTGNIAAKEFTEWHHNLKMCLDNYSRCFLYNSFLKSAFTIQPQMWKKKMRTVLGGDLLFKDMDVTMNTPLMVMAMSYVYIRNPKLIL